MRKYTKLIARLLITAFVLSPAFAGDLLIAPIIIGGQANTATVGTNNNSLATTAFVNATALSGVAAVTTVAGTNANGFAWSIATPNSTPNMTLSTSVTGVLKGNGTAISAATAGTDYLTPSGSAAALTSFPTFNQSTTGSAATLTTPRAIYGNNFDGSAALTQIIASTYGGTGNGFAKLAGPASSEKTWTGPNANANLLTDNALVTVAQGGTGAGTLTGVLIGNGTSAVTVKTNPTGAFVGTTDTQTLTNKSLTAPDIGAATGTSLSLSSTLSATGHTTLEGVTSTGATGTGNLVYSASPTFTGTLNGANLSIGTLTLTGSSTGTTAITSANASASNYTLTIPAITGTAVTTGDTGTVTPAMLAVSAAPTIASGFGSSPSIVHSKGAKAFTLNVGTGGTASAGVVTLPAAVGTGWTCTVMPNGAPQAAAAMYSAPTSSTSITITNYTASTGIALAWSASAVLQVKCEDY